MTDNITERTIENLKIIIALSDMSAAQVSVKAGLSINSLGKYLRGDTSISYANMAAVCKVLGVPIGLISSPSQITPARIRLFKEMQIANDGDMAYLLDRLLSKK